MANTITLTSSGKIAYEDFAGQTDGDPATSVDFDTIVVPVGQYYKVATQQGRKCITASDNTFLVDVIAAGGNNALRKTAYANATLTWLIQRMDLRTGAWEIVDGAAYIANAWSQDSIYINQYWRSDSRLVAFTPPTRTAADLWVLKHTYISPTFNQGVYKATTGTPNIHGQIGTKVTPVYTTAATNLEFTMESRYSVDRYYSTCFGFYTDRYITITGLIAGMKVQLLNASTDAIEYTGAANGTSTAIDLFGILFPCSYKFRVIGTDGSTLLTTDAQSINGGDSWAYDGATSGGGTPPPARVEVLSFENLNTGTSGKITFTTTDATAYRIYRAERPFEAFTLAATVTTGEHTFTDLTTQTEYQFYIVGTNDGGNALPSDVIQGLVYGQEFNYLANTAETVKTLIELNFPQFRTVHIGEKQIMPNQIPSIFIIPVDESPGDFAHLSGQYDIKYRFNIRVYSQGASANSESILDNQKLLGKLKLQLEAIKNYHPYWYYSEVEQTTFDNLDTDKQLKYSELTFMTTRRIPRKY